MNCLHEVLNNECVHVQFLVALCDVALQCQLVESSMGSAGEEWFAVDGALL